MVYGIIIATYIHSTLVCTFNLYILRPSNDKSYTPYKCCGPVNDSFNMSQIEVSCHSNNCVNTKNNIRTGHKK